MDDRPVLIGMNNPYSVRPEAALLPAPRGCAGWNLWRMLDEVRPTSRMEYSRVFDRRNLLNERLWNALRAARAGEDLWRALEGRTVMVLGREPVLALNLPRTPEIIWSVSRGVRWCYVPHPSGLNRWYSEEVNRIAVGVRLEQLLENFLGAPVRV